MATWNLSHTTCEQLDPQDLDQQPFVERKGYEIRLSRDCQAGSRGTVIALKPGFRMTSPHVGEYGEGFGGEGLIIRTIEGYSSRSYVEHILEEDGLVTQTSYQNGQVERIRTFRFAPPTSQSRP